ncbi:MAG: response regulator transcription factor [Dehalococcoidia bacterium]
MEESYTYSVVVVDDEPEFRHWLRTLFGNSVDFRVVGEAANGSEAIDIIPSLKPDLVIADMYMPPPDGLEVTRCIQERFPGTRAVLVSAYAERVYERLAKEAGALTFIPKVSFSLEALRLALRGEE